MIEDTPENRAKVIQAGECLLGTCKSADTVIQEVFGDEDLTLTDLAMPLLEALDDLTMCCEACGWWCETGFLNDNQVCNDCEPEDDDE